jgi:hypothetical protein
MKDLQADWKKWTRAERISALVGFPFLIMLAPALAASAVLVH